MKKCWKRGAAALLSAVLAMSGVFSAGAVYAEGDPAGAVYTDGVSAAAAGAEEVTGPGAMIGAGNTAFGKNQTATASDASVSEKEEKTVSEASASDADYDEDGLLVDGEIRYDLDATGSDAELEEPELPDQLIGPEFPDDLELEEYTDIIYFSDALDNDALFGQYVDKVFGVENASGRMLLRKSVSAHDALSGSSALLYPLMAASIQQVSEGNLESTIFEYTVDQIGTETFYSAEELGVDKLIEGNLVTKDALNAMLEKYGLDIGLTMDALRMDVPFYMYWVSYAEVGISFGFNMSEGKIRIASVRISVPVATAFQGSQYAVDTTKTAAPLAAKANADAVVDAYKGSGISDLKKLIGYRDKIIDLATYDYNAASTGTGGASSTNPWQMVYVFDGDPDTNVVCEGYSKAFKYLCDNTDFNDDSISCYIMTGNFAQGDHGEGHMWNVVSFGKDDNVVNYLADITHCDNFYDPSGSNNYRGFGDERFLIGVQMNGTSGFTIPEGRIAIQGQGNAYFNSEASTYTYDSQVISLYSEKERTLSGEDYNFPVSLVSADTNGNTSVVNLQGGGKVYPSRLTGDGEVTVVAPAKDGYRFLGWYSGEAAGGNVSGAQLLTSSYSQTLPVEKEEKLVAVYETAGNVSLTVNGTAFTVTEGGNSTDASGSFSGSYSAGTKITLAFTGENFNRWCTPQGVLLSASASYSVTLTGDTVIKAESASAAEGVSLVRFLTEKNQTIWSGQWTAAQAQANYDRVAKDTPVRSWDGYPFDHWSMTKDQVVSEINAGTKVIDIFPVYSSSPTYCNITLVFVGDDSGESAILSTVDRSGKVGSYLALDPYLGGQFSNYTFQYWALDSAGKKIITYSRHYNYGLSNNQTIYAIFKRNQGEMAQVEPVPIITIEKGRSTGSIDDGNLRHKFTCRLDLAPEGKIHYECLDAGILYDNQRKYTVNNEEAFRLEGGASRASFGVPEGENYSFDARVLDKGNGVVVRGYVQVQSSEYGVQTFYSEILSAGVTADP